MSQHTPEPWHLYELSHVIYRRDAGGKAHGIARVYGGDKLANARRIVACVNRLAGFATEDIEKHDIDLHGVNHWINRATRAEQQLVAANFQRDELLAMLKKSAQWIDDCGAQAGTQLMLDEISAVIAKCEARL